MSEITVSITCGFLKAAYGASSLSISALNRTIVHHFIFCAGVRALQTTGPIDGGTQKVTLRFGRNTLPYTLRGPAWTHSRHIVDWSIRADCGSVY